MDEETDEATSAGSSGAQMVDMLLTNAFDFTSYI